jgi:hypothetical protein
MHKDESMSFRLFTFGKEVDFTVAREQDPDTTEAQVVTIVTLTGKMRAQLVLGVGSERRHVTGLVHFDAVGVDRALPGEGKDSFTLTLHLGPRLSKALETDTLTASGVVKGEVEGHTTGGD